MLRRVLLVTSLVTGALSGCGPSRDPVEAKIEAAQTRRYVVADGSVVGFVGWNASGSHTGGFEAFAGEIAVEGGDPLKSTVKLEVDAGSLWADDDGLAERLKGPDLFDVATHPTLALTSTAIMADADGAAQRLQGTLTIHGVTKSISVPLQITVTPERVAARTQFTINRSDFEMTGQVPADDPLRDELQIVVELTAVPAEQAS